MRSATLRHSVNRLTQTSNLLIIRGFCAAENDIEWRQAQIPMKTKNAKILLTKKGFHRRRKVQVNGGQNADKGPSSVKDQRVQQNRADEKIKPLFLHLSNLLACYQGTLLGEIDQQQVHLIKQKHEDGVDVIPEVFDQAEHLHVLCKDGSNAEIDWPRIIDTEIIYQDICRSMQQIIGRTTSLEVSQAHVAERLLRIFLDIRADRANLVYRLKPKDKPKSIISLAKSCFFPSSSQEKEEIKITAHEDSSFAPLERHVDDIISAVFNVLPSDTTDVSVLSQRADRLISMLDLYSGGTPSVNSMLCVLRAQSAVGTIKRADEAQRLWRRTSSDLPSPQLFYQVLRAYEFASTREKDFKLQSKCIHEIEKLVLEEWGDAEINNSSKGKSFSIAVRAMSGLSVQLLPDSCERAENLAIKHLGEQSFAKMFVNPDETSFKEMEMISITDMHLVRSLLNLYSSYPDSRRLEQGMQLLRFLELQHEMRQKGGKKIGRGRKDNPILVSSFTDSQWLSTYRSMIIGIRNYTFSPNRKKEDKSPDSLQNINLATYAHGLLDRMDAVSISPDSDIFVRLLKIWRRVRSKKSGEFAEDILTKMQLREACNPSVHVTEDVYRSVLWCWYEAALAGHPEAVKRANYLLRSMEVQSGIQEVQTVDSSSQMEVDIQSAVYKTEVRPTIQTYNHVIAICGQVRSGRDKEEVVNIALDLHQRILDAGLEPTKKTYLALFKCLKTHLDKDSPLRISAGEEILRLANGNKELLVPTVIKALKDLDSSLHKQYLNSVEKALS